MGEYQKALIALDNALQLKSDFSNALLAKGIILGKIGKKEEAKKIAEKLIENKNKQAPITEKTNSAQSLNESIRAEFQAAQKRFNEKYSTPN